MALQTAIVEPDGRLVLPPEVQRELQIPPGATVDIRVQDASKLIRELRGMFAGQPSLEDEYLRDRDTDAW